MGKYFGTDGIRGVVGVELNAMLAFKVGKAAAYTLTEEKGKKRAKILIGKDTRVSSDMLEAALIAGICSVGVDVELLGVIPTPAIAYLTLRHKADAGIVISASHNSFEYNGIKIFGFDGYKIPDATEEKIEHLVDNIDEIPVTDNEKIGRILQSKISPVEEYVNFLASTITGNLSGLKVAVDCANGAASATASRLFSKLNCDIEIRYYEPDGFNINEGCGSTHLENLKERVLKGGFDVGVAFDGDADRCLIVDDTGEIIDGDRIMAVCAATMREAGKLRGNAFVATVLSNMGLHAYAKEQGMEIKCSNVGDRFVLEMMRENGYVLGGEQSGHVIFLEYVTTGDGQLTAIQFLKILKDKGVKCSEISAEVKPYPQVMINIKVPNDKKKTLSNEAVVIDAIAKAEKKLGDGRILVRPSGTEALVRVMCEGIDSALVNECAEEISEVIRQMVN